VDSVQFKDRHAFVFPIVGTGPIALQLLQTREPDLRGMDVRAGELHVRAARILHLPSTREPLDLDKRVLRSQFLAKRSQRNPGDAQDAVKLPHFESPRFRKVEFHYHL